MKSPYFHLPKHPVLSRMSPARRNTSCRWKTGHPPSPGTWEQTSKAAHQSVTKYPSFSPCFYTGIIMKMSVTDCSGMVPKCALTAWTIGFVLSVPTDKCEIKRWCFGVGMGGKQGGMGHKGTSWQHHDAPTGLQEHETLGGLW